MQIGEGTVHVHTECKCGHVSVHVSGHMSLSVRIYTNVCKSWWVSIMLIWPVASNPKLSFTAVPFISICCSLMAFFLLSKEKDASWLCSPWQENEKYCLSWLSDFIGQAVRLTFPIGVFFFIALAFRVKAIADCCSTKLGKERESERDWFRSLFPWQRWCWQQGNGGVWHLFECSLIKWEKITSCGYWMEVVEIMLKLNDWVLVFSLLALVFFSSKWEIGSRWV